MPGFGALHADLTEMRVAATTLRCCADALARQSRAVAENSFGAGSSDAGRDYAAQAAAIHAGFTRVAAFLHRWSSAALLTADVFDHAAAEYERLDRERAASAGAAQP
ncbi:hypothetical protein ABZ319_31575 [Nocardia sp. NPDC005978]|uniref:hypothetical protein n=1 Tax=Nocardia sp. NPDC005978 TaxID=3156725 RepID=UPI0033A9C9C4